MNCSIDSPPLICTPLNVIKPLLTSECLMAAKRQQSDWQSKTLATKKLLYEHRVTAQRWGRCKNLRQNWVWGRAEGRPLPRARTCRGLHVRMRITHCFPDYDSVAKGTGRRVLLPISAVFTDSRRPLTQAGKVNWARTTP